MTAIGKPFRYQILSCAFSPITFWNSRKAAWLNRSISIHVSGELNWKTADVSGCDLGDFISGHQIFLASGIEQLPMITLDCEESLPLVAKQLFLCCFRVNIFWGKCWIYMNIWGQRYRIITALVFFCFPAHTHTPQHVVMHQLAVDRAQR